MRNGILIKVGKKLTGALALTFLIVGSFSQISRADDGGCLGGDVPTPFKNANQKVELAEGEYYILNGTVRIVGDTPLFRVDLSRHGWLESQQRKENPYYYLQGGADYWQTYAGKSVQLFAIARVRLVRFAGRLTYSIELDSQVQPKTVRKEGPCRCSVEDLAKM